MHTIINQLNDMKRGRIRSRGSPHTSFVCI